MLFDFEIVLSYQEGAGLSTGLPTDFVDKEEVIHLPLDIADQRHNSGLFSIETRYPVFCIQIKNPNQSVVFNLFVLKIKKNGVKSRQKSLKGRAKDLPFKFAVRMRMSSKNYLRCYLTTIYVQNLASDVTRTGDCGFHFVALVIMGSSVDGARSYDCVAC